MKRSETLSIGSLFEQLLAEEPDLHESYLEHKLLALLPSYLGSYWQDIHTAKVHDGVLHLRTYSAALRNALLLDKQVTLSGLNKELGAELLRDIRVS